MRSPGVPLLLAAAFLLAVPLGSPARAEAPAATPSQEVAAGTLLPGGMWAVSSPQGWAFDVEETIELEHPSRLCIAFTRAIAHAYQDRLPVRGRELEFLHDDSHLSVRVKRGPITYMFALTLEGQPPEVRAFTLTRKGP